MGNLNSASVSIWLPVQQRGHDLWISAFEFVEGSIVRLAEIISTVDMLLY